MPAPQSAASLWCDAVAERLAARPRRRWRLACAPQGAALGVRRASLRRRGVCPEGCTCRGSCSASLQPRALTGTLFCLCVCVCVCVCAVARCRGSGRWVASSSGTLSGTSSASEVRALPQRGPSWCPPPSHRGCPLAGGGGRVAGRWRRRARRARWRATTRRARSSEPRGASAARCAPRVGPRAGACSAPVGARAPCARGGWCDASARVTSRRV